MKAELQFNGTIILSPETGMEAYALNKWAAENYTVNSGWRPACLLIATDCAVVGSPNKTAST